jgi:hypothetical protein
MDRAFGLVVYALVYRVAIIAAGTLFMFLGYKLFDKEAERTKNAAFEGNLAGANISLKKRRFGVVLCIVRLHHHHCCGVPGSVLQFSR